MAQRRCITFTSISSTSPLRYLHRLHSVLSIAHIGASPRTMFIAISFPNNTPAHIVHTTHTLGLLEGKKGKTLNKHRPCNRVTTDKPNR